MCATGSVCSSTMCLAFLSARFSLMVLTGFLVRCRCGDLSGIARSLKVGARDEPVLLRLRSGYLNVHDADEPVPDALVLAADQSVVQGRKLVGGVVRAADVAEVRPPLLGPRGFREPAHGTGQLDPHRAHARAVGPGLKQPRRRAVEELAQFGLGQSGRDTVTVGHFQRNIKDLGSFSSRNHPSTLRDPGMRTVSGPPVLGSFQTRCPAVRQAVRKAAAMPGTPAAALSVLERRVLYVAIVASFIVFLDG